MKKKIFLFCLLSLSIFGQTNTSKVSYTVIANAVSKKAVLIFNKDKSVFLTEIIKNDKKVEVKSNEEENNIELKIDLNTNLPSSFGMFTNLTNNVIIEHAFHPRGLKATEFDTLFVKEKAKNINWELVDETKIISSFTCQKAIGKFRGRTYTVWFTNDIPISVGPWKLNGLPGLILEASDTKKQFHFFADKVELNTNEIINDSVFLNKKYITPMQERERFLTYMENIGLEISTKIKSSLPRGVNSTSITTSTKIIDEEKLIEINFNDIQSKK
ncbi:GLPGLI family protein [Flavobacterium jejuense]|uniref:GLPGLI family protein n=1 Tax=Flavobacterium jejuense TaxID=1544455 RepID=A0ABX0IS00_9FLAO|nr:GLPGLI family protein [Flavobacterium jejuense]NHN26346.1 GLPGLI family protein [Flavobacterium jejuense]